MVLLLMRWDGILAMSAAKYLSIPVLYSITDIFTEELTDVLRVEKFLADDGTWKGTSTKVNTGVQQIGFLQVNIRILFIAFDILLFYETTHYQKDIILPFTFAGSSGSSTGSSGGGNTNTGMTVTVTGPTILPSITTSAIASTAAAHLEMLAAASSVASSTNGVPSLGPNAQHNTTA